MVARDYSPSSNAGLFIVAAIRSREDRHRFALPGEPEPGYRARRARAQDAALMVALAVLAVLSLTIGG